MTLARSDLLAQLQNQFGALATETGQVVTDTVAGYGPAIDFALRQTGTLQANLTTGTIPTGSEDAGFRLAEYAALRRFAAALSMRVDIQLDAPLVNKKRSQYLANVKTLIDELRKELEELGYLGASYSMGWLELDYLEPASEF